MRSIAFADFLIGVGILFVLEGLMFAASPAWMRRAMKSALATPDNILRAVGIGSAVVGLILILAGRRERWRGQKTSGINVLVSGGGPPFPRFKGAFGGEKAASAACALAPFGG